MSSMLTSGAIRAIYDGDQDSSLHKNFIVQIIDIKPIITSTETRYRLTLSDGVQITLAMLGSGLNKLVEDQKMKRKSTIRINKSEFIKLPEKKILVISEAEIIVTDVGFIIDTSVPMEPHKKGDNILHIVREYSDDPNKIVNTRDMILTGDMGVGTKVRLWGSLAEECDITTNSIMTFKGTRVRTINGRDIFFLDDMDSFKQDLPEYRNIQSFFNDKHPSFSSSNADDIVKDNTK